VVFLYHHRRADDGGSSAGVLGLTLEGASLALDPSYPVRDQFPGSGVRRVYGQRVLFDNGIYFMNYNAGSSPEKLRHDWPDRFRLASSLHPYSGAWHESGDNDRPYFTRGGEFDFDNAAIWQGAMLKYRGRYYLYYENFHAIDDVDQAYQNYDDIHAGSRVGYATAN